MWKRLISLVAVCGAACAAIALKPDRPADYPPLAVTVEVAEASAEARAIAERLTKKDQLIGGLIVGIVRLAEAAEAVIALNREWPAVPPKLYEGYPGRSLSVRVAHMLVAAVEKRLDAGDPRRDAILARLIHDLSDITAGGKSAPD